MKMLECTAGAVDASVQGVATSYVRPVARALEAHLLLPNVRTRSAGGVGLYEVLGSAKGWAGEPTECEDVAFGIDPTSFPTRLGPPPDSPPVN